MKRSLAVVLLFLVSSSLYAANRTQRFVKKGAITFRKAEATAGAFSRLRRQAEAASRRTDVGASAVIRNSSSRELVIPSAGSVRGAGNTFYRSDVTFVNYNDEDQEVAVFWFPNGAGPEGIELAFVTIPGGAPPETVEDFVGSVMDVSGVGSLIFFPVIGEDFDTNAAIDIFSRIWSPQPNASGVVSFPFPAVDFDHLGGPFEAIILGLRQDAQHRTNYGIVNLSAADSLDFIVSVVNEGGFLFESEPISLEAGSMIQTSLPAGNFGNFSLLVNVVNDETLERITWTAYASSNNNISQDGWVSIASNLFDDEDLDEFGAKAPRAK